MTKAEILRQAIKSERAISVRTEDQSLEDHEHLFIDTPHLEIISSMAGPANQVIFGRRGTGKTMLLRKLLRDGQPPSTAGDYIAIGLQVEDFKRSPDVSESDPVSVKARSYFRSFLQQVADRMIGLGEKVLQNEGLLAKIGLKNNARKGLLEDRFLRLHEILRYGVARTNPIAASRVDSSASEYDMHSSHVRSSGVKFNSENVIGVGQDSLLPSANVSLGGKYSSEKSDGSLLKQKAVSQTCIESSYDLGAPEIRTLIREIIETLQVKYLMILIDEWQSLGECQAEFAHYLKSCFFGLDCVSVKIAAYRNICKFNNGGTRDNFRGIEIGQDISIVGDVDLPPAKDTTQKFFLDILFGRLVYKEPRLATFYGPLHDYNAKQLVKDIFRNSNTVEMLVRGSHGISRDFLEAFRIASSKIVASQTRIRLTLDDIQNAHGKLSRAVQENVSKADDIGGLLFEHVKPHVHQTRVPFFFISRSITKWDEFLWELIDKRALHVVEARNLPDGADVEWRAYEVSYGLFEEWRRAMSFSNRNSPDNHLTWTDIRELKSKEFNKYVLNFGGQPRAVRTCPFCGFQFSTSEHAFIKKQLCPNCYEPQSVNE